MAEKRDPVTHRTKTQKKADNKKNNARPAEIKKRGQRVAARRLLEKEGRVSKGDGKDIDHKTPLSRGGGNSKSNLRVVSQKTNRSHKLGTPKKGR
jgi:hypothetical protein